MVVSSSDEVMAVKEMMNSKEWGRGKGKRIQNTKALIVMGSDVAGRGSGGGGGYDGGRIQTRGGVEEVMVLTHGLNGVGILSHHAKGALEVVVDLVHVLVQDLVVEEAMEEVVPSVLQDQATKELCQEDVP